MCKLFGLHKKELFGRDLTQKFGEYAAHPDRICVYCGQKETWFSSYKGKPVYQNEKNSLELNF